MRRLFFTVLLSAAAAYAQVYIAAESVVYADAGSGSITAYAYTLIYDYNYNPSETTYYFYADVNGTLQPNNIFMAAETNSCGVGCAMYEIAAQVQSLGSTLSLNSNHVGQGYDDVYSWFWYGTSTSATYGIPGPPSLTFNQVDARNPNNVLWGISTGGASPWQVNFYFAGNFQITQGGVAQTDHMGYPSGFSQAYLQGVNYGLAFLGQSCLVFRADNLSRGQSNATTVNIGAENDIEPGTLPLASVAQVGAYTLTQITYYDGCAYLLYPGSMTTRLLGVSDSINTLNNPSFLDVDIMSFIPTAMYPPTFAPISLPPATWNVITPPIPYGMEGRFKTNGFDWSAPTMQDWIPNPPPCTGLCAVQMSQVCPTGLLVGSQASMVPANPGCWFVPIP